MDRHLARDLDRYIERAQDEPHYRIIKEEARKAKISHKCVNCSQVIQPGETYRRILFEDDDYVVGWAKMHFGFCDYYEEEIDDQY